MTATMAKPKDGSSEGLEALHRLKTADPVLFVSPSPDLSRDARAASQYLFSSLLPFCPKAPFDRLLVDGFDAEQIWQQIDVQTQPLISNLRRELRHFERNTQEISKFFRGIKNGRVDSGVDEAKEGDFEDDGKQDGKVNNKLEVEEDEFDDEAEGDDDEDVGAAGSLEAEEEVEDGLEEEDEEEDEEESVGAGIEDRFLKIKELEEYLVKDEKKEYGEVEGEEDEDDEDEDEGEDDEDGDEDGDEDDDEEEEDEVRRKLLLSVTD